MRTGGAVVRLTPRCPRSGGWRLHEYGVMDLMGGFLDGGLDVAAGWRSWEDMGADEGGIAPDGLGVAAAQPLWSWLALR